MLISQEIFESFLKNFPDNWVFRQYARKSHAGFWNSLQIDMINGVFAITKNVLKIFSKTTQTIVFFLKNRETLTQSFEIILKIDQPNAFWYFLKKTLKTF